MKKETKKTVEKVVISKSEYEEIFKNYEKAKRKNDGDK